MSTQQTTPRDRTAVEGGVYILAILLRYRWFIGVTTLLVAIASLAIAIASLRLPPEESFLPNVYRAQTRLLMGEDPSEGGLTALLEAFGMTVPETHTTVTTGRLALQVLESHSFIDRIIERNNMVEHYSLHESTRTRRRNAMRSRTTYAFDAGTGILTIGYQDISPHYAYSVVESIVSELRNWFQTRGGLTRGRTLESLEATLTEVEAEVTRLENEIRAFQQRYGVLSIEELASMQADTLRELEAELIRLDRTIRTYAERTRLENDPELIRLRSERAAVVDLIDRVYAGFYGGRRTMPAISELPDLALTLNRLRSDLEIQQRLRTSLRQQFEVARLSAATLSAFAILEPAEVPDEKIGPSRARLCIMSTVAAFGASVAVSFLHFGLKMLLHDPYFRRAFGSRRPTQSAPTRAKPLRASETVGVGK